MTIEIGVKSNDTTKQKGDLLEKLAKKLLEAQNYDVETEIRNTGMELDLLCSNKVNVNKKIYVECKAYKESNKIQSDVIKNIVGIQSIEGYEEVWLISTTELGKDAKGLVSKLIDEQQRKDIVIYTPKKLMQALENSKTIISLNIIENKLKSVLDDVKNIYERSILVITDFGYFYLFEIKENGNDKGVVVYNAENGELVEEHKLLENISLLKTSLNTLDFMYISKIKSNSLVPIIESDDININSIKLNKQYLERINDTGIKLTHPNKSELTLDDIFVFQDFQDLEDKKKIRINSEKLLDINNIEKAMIFGEEVSGKSSLMFILQKKLNDKDFIPLYFNAKNLKNSNYDKFINRLVNNFKKQYYDLDKSEIIKLLDNNKDKFVILIDNFEALSIKKLEARAKFLEMLNANFNNILICADDSLEMEIMTKDELKSKIHDFKFFRIKEYGYQLRDKVIEKWLTIGQEETIDDNYLLERKDEVFKMIETIIGNKFIPTYPLYIITLLQQIEAGTGNNLGGSAYAEFYNYLINQAMGTTKIKPEELDYYHTYLSYIAYHYFKDGRKELDKKEIETLHDAYGKEYHKKSFTSVYENLINAKFIKVDNEFYSFNHNYIYYFYVAKYLSDNMEEEAISVEIDMLIKRLYRTEFANIIIFLIHHSKTRAKSIIGKILSEAKMIFDNITPSTLSKEELININQLVSSEMKLILEDNKPAEYRKKELELNDEKEEKNGNSNEEENGFMPSYNEDIHELDIFGKINLSFKLMEILGQISKNYYGSIKNDAKDEILNELSELGLRNLHLLLDHFSEYSELLEKDIREIIEKQGTSTEAEIEMVTKRIIFNFAEAISMNFIKKIANSMASKNLFDSIDNISVQKNTEAMKLINIATKLDFSGGLNNDKIIKLSNEFSDNLIVKDLLKRLVIEHLYKFNVTYKKKQEVCAKLNISIETQQNILVHKSKD